MAEEDKQKIRDYQGLQRSEYEELEQKKLETENMHAKNMEYARRYGEFSPLLWTTPGVPLSHLWPNHRRHCRCH